MSATQCWQASESRRENCQLQLFLHTVNQQHQLNLHDYAALHAWSIENLAAFWQDVWDFFHCHSDTAITSVLQPAMPGAQWFTGATLNFAQHLLRYNDEHPAILFSNERNQHRLLTYAQLQTAVAQCQAGLRRAGVGVGDRVAGLLPNIPETVIAMLATTSLGAIWSACSPDFGEQGVVDRFGQINPKVLFTTDAALYAGKRVSTLNKAQRVQQQCPDCLVVMIPYVDECAHSPDATLYAEFIESNAQVPDFISLPFNHPVVIVYSSGTTGAPKCITHGAGGTLLQHFKELGLHTDITRDDVVFYYTTCSWMMWNWLISSLGLGAAVVLYDGSPVYPTTTRLLDITDELGISIFGASAKYFQTLEKTGCQPSHTHDLRSLKTLLSTGSPLLPEQYDYIYQQVKTDICLASISGGTDLLSCFALACPLKPVIRGQLQCLGLGMDVAIYNAQGQAVTQEKGELVCRQPFPSMPIYFWNDKDNQQYHRAYFEKYPGVWAHGDYAELTAEQGLIIYGRSDTTLNPGGIRIGTAEIYRIVESFPDIAESLCVGQTLNNDEKIRLFVVMRDNKPLTNALQIAIKQALREQISPHHVPHTIHAVSGLPRTISGKLVEVAVKNILAGRHVDNTQVLANPEILSEFELISRQLLHSD